jgi:hypothetical protein
MFSTDAGEEIVVQARAFISKASQSELRSIDRVRCFLVAHCPELSRF